MSVAKKQKLNIPPARKGKSNIVLAFSFWGLCLLLALFCVQGNQQQVEEATVPASYVELPTTARSRNNWVYFNERAPRKNLMVAIIPGGSDHPAELSVYLCSEWKQEDAKTRRHLIHHWKSLWSQGVQATSYGRERPVLHFHQTNRSIHSVDAWSKTTSVDSSDQDLLS